jgi:VWFA-related protein
VTRALAAALVAFTAIAGGAGQQQRPTFRSRTDLVSVDISITTDKRPVAGLALPDFELTDNGVRQKIELLDAETLPIDLSIVLDQSSSMARSFDSVKTDAREIAAMLRPSDRIRLITFAGDIKETVDFQPPAGDLSLHTLAASGSTSLFDAVAAAIVRRRDGERRHLMVVLTDGYDTSSLLGRDALDDLSRRSDAAIYAAVSRPSVPIYPPPPFRPQTEPLEHRRTWMAPMSKAGDETPLKVAVENTGGVWESLWSIGRAPAGVKRALDWFRSAYVARYRASGVAAGGWHELRIRVTRPGSYDVRARRGYYAD